MIKTKKGNLGRGWAIMGLLGIAGSSWWVKPAMAEGGEDWRPKAAHYRWQETQEECSLVGAVMEKTQTALKSRSSEAKRLAEITQGLFQTLSECRQNRKEPGAPSSSQDDLEIPEVCRENYEAWLNEGRGLVAAEEEVEKLKEEIRGLKEIVGRKCKNLIP